MKMVFTFIRQFARFSFLAAILVMLAAPCVRAAPELPDTSRSNMLVHRDGDTVSLDTQTGTDGNPLDEIGETDTCYMVEWPFMFLESLRSDLWRDAVEINGIRYDVNAPRVPSPDAEVSVPKSQADGKR